MDEKCEICHDGESSEWPCQCCGRLIKEAETKLKNLGEGEAVTGYALLSDVADLKGLFLSDLNKFLKDRNAEICVTPYRNGGYNLYANIKVDGKIISVEIDDCDY